MFYRLKKSDFIKNFIILASGTGFSQALPILVSPIITRLYTPEDFGYLSVYLSIVSVISIIATARYEFAIVLPTEKSEAIDILKLCLRIGILVNIIILILFILFQKEIFFFFNIKLEVWLIYLMPVSILFIGLNQTLNYFFIREKKFTYISQSRVGQSLSLALSRIFFGFLQLSRWGLVFSELIGNITALIIQIKTTSFNLKKENNFLKVDRFYSLLKKYKEFPIYNLLPSFLDSLTLSLPIFFVTKFFSAEVAGHLGLCNRILTIPATILATSMAQILLQKTAEMRRNNQPTLEFVFRITKKMFLVLIIPAAIIILFGEKLFIFIFGSKWSLAGLFASYLSIPFFLRLIVSPLSVIFISFEKLHIGAFWQIGYFFISFIVLYIASKYEIEVFILIYALNELFMYLIYFSLIIYTIKKQERSYVWNSWNYF